MKKTAITLICALVAPLCIYAQSSVGQPDTIKLVVSGTGVTEAEAINSAIGDAIRQVYVNVVSENTQHISSIPANCVSYEELSTFILPGSHKNLTFVKASVPIKKITEYAKSAGSNAELSTATFGQIIKLQELQKSNADSTMHRMFRVLSQYIPYMYDFDIEINNFYQDGTVELTAFLKANKYTRGIGDFIFNILNAIGTDSKNAHSLNIAQSSPTWNYYETLAGIAKAADLAYSSGLAPTANKTEINALLTGTMLLGSLLSERYTYKWFATDIQTYGPMFNELFTEAVKTFVIVDNFSNKYLNTAENHFFFPKHYLHFVVSTELLDDNILDEVASLEYDFSNGNITDHDVEKKITALMPDSLTGNINGSPQGLYGEILYLPFLTEVGDTVARIPLEIHVPAEELLQISGFNAVRNTTLDPKAEILPPSPKRTYDYDIVEEKPSFRGGGTNNFVNWVYSNLNYPQEAIEKGISGRVTLQIIIEIDGSISAKVLKGVDPSLDEEALRVASRSPKWEPGKIDGKAVRVTYEFPILFQN